MSQTSVETQKQEHSWIGYPPLRNALLAAFLALFTFVLHSFGLFCETTTTALFILAIALGGYLWIYEGIEEFIEHRQVTISILMIAATLGAAYLSMWDEAAALVILYGAAEGIEEYTFTKTRRAIRSLLDLAPKEARLL